MKQDPVDRAFGFYEYASQHPEILERIPAGAIVLWVEPDTPVSVAHTEAKQVAERNPGKHVVIVTRTASKTGKGGPFEAFELAAV